MLIHFQLQNHPSESLFHSLLSMYDNYCEAIRTIRETNNIFEVYTFLSILTNIPLMIFTMITLSMNVTHDTREWMEILYSVPEIYFVLVEIFCLTFSPAAIQSTVS